MAFLRSEFLLQRRPSSTTTNIGLSSSLSLWKLCWILVFLKACDAILLANAPTFDLPPEEHLQEDQEEFLLSSPSQYNTNYDINLYRMRRNALESPHTSQFRMNDLSRAFGRLHFGPLLRLRSISSRASSSAPAAKTQFVSSDPPRVKKALSYLSRFYPMFQSSHIAALQPYQSLRSSRRRLTASFSGEAFPAARSHRPTNMRLRWGK